MIKLVLAAVWICAVSVGAVLYSFQISQARSEASPLPAFFGGLDYVSTGIISIPVVKEGSVSGYFLARLSYTVEPEVMNALTVPAKILLIDQMYTTLYANPQIDYSSTTKVDLDAFRAGLRDGINERVGKKLVHEVLIEQADFLSKSEIRDNTLRRRIAPESTPQSGSSAAKSH